MLQGRAIIFWLRRSLIAIGMSVVIIFFAGTLAHRYPRFFSTSGIMFPALTVVWLWISIVRRPALDPGNDEMAISEAGIRLLMSPDELIPWDEIQHVRFSKFRGTIVVHSRALGGRRTISRKSPQQDAGEVFDKAAALFKKCLAADRWHEHWL